VVADAKKLAERRNRIVHDCWVHDGENAKQVRVRSKVEKSQAGQPLEVLPVEVRIVPVEEVWDLANAFQCVANQFWILFTPVLDLTMRNMLPKVIHPPAVASDSTASSG